MIVVALISISAFLSAFLGCVQAINVNRRRFFWAALTSIGISACQLSLYKLVPGISEPAQAMAFVVCGVLGAQTSMLVATRRAQK